MTDILPKRMRLVIAGLELKAAKTGLTPSERLAHANLMLDAERKRAQDRQEQGQGSRFAFVR